MDSASLQFVFFGLAAALISNLSRSPAWRSAVLMAASILFLALLAKNPMLFLPLIGFLLLGYGGLILLQHGWSRVWVWCILAVLCAYIWLKKYTFLPEAIFLHVPYFTLGLSYIFFRVLHLLIEAGDANERQRVSIGAYLLYTLNFTTFVSGPIQRYDQFARDQFAAEPIPLGSRVVGLQLERIVRGFFKVNVLGAIFQTMHTDAVAQISYALPLSVRSYAALRLAIVFPLYLYSNFSGYIDIVIALARLMRVRLPENFDRPFSASSFIDFWNRWHITLSTWLKTYVYNPLLLVLMRRNTSIAFEPFLGVLCFFVTFFLVGVWHGRTSEFVFFGVLLGAGVSINKLWQVLFTRVLGRKSYKELTKNPIYVSFGRGLTFSWFAFSNLWFWADWHQLHALLAALGAAQWLAVWLAVWLFATLTLALWELLRAALLSIKTAEGPALASRYARVVYASAMGLCTLVITILLSQPPPAVIYKAF